MNKSLILAVFICLAAMSIFGQDFSSYKDRTIAQITDLNRLVVDAAVRKVKDEAESELIGSDPLYSKVTLQFLGAARPISEGRKKVIAGWGKSLKLEKKTTDLYVNELKFAEGGKEYWLGIPNSMIPMIAGKVKKGDAVGLYVSYSGAFKAKDQKEFETILLITAVQ